MRLVDPAVLAAPRAGLMEVLVDYWWPMDARGHVALYVPTGSRGHQYPQANQSRAIAESLGPTVLGDAYAGVVCLPVAFLPHRCDR